MGRRTEVGADCESRIACRLKVFGESINKSADSTRPKTAKGLRRAKKVCKLSVLLWFRFSNSISQEDDKIMLRSSNEKDLDLIARIRITHKT